MSIEYATMENLEECLDMLYTQELGMRYYPNRKLLQEELVKGYSKSEIFVKKVTGGGGGNRL